MADSRNWRASVVLPKEMEDSVYKLRQRDEFARCSISEVLRMLLEKGLETYGYSNAGVSDQSA